MPTFQCENHESDEEERVTNLQMVRDALPLRRRDNLSNPSLHVHYSRSEQSVNMPMPYSSAVVATIKYEDHTLPKYEDIFPETKLQQDHQQRSSLAAGGGENHI